MSKERREGLVGSLMPFYLWRYHYDEPKALEAAFNQADRVIAESDKREKDGE